MAVNTVEQLITRDKEISFELGNLEEELERLKNEHRNFWLQYENQCAQTLHDLTPEQIKRNKIRVAGSALTMQDVKMRFGYKCPYCRCKIGGTQSGWAGCTYWDGYVKTSFNIWLNKDISNWPPDKQTLYMKAKKEVEEYFDAAEPLEQRIESLRREKKEILQDLDTIWHMCDKVLGKSREYEATIAKLNRKLTPYDRDRYYND